LQLPGIQFHNGLFFIMTMVGMRATIRMTLVFVIVPLVRIDIVMVRMPIFNVLMLVTRPIIMFIGTRVFSMLFLIVSMAIGHSRITLFSSTGIADRETGLEQRKRC